MSPAKQPVTDDFDDEEGGWSEASTELGEKIDWETGLLIIGTYEGKRLVPQPDGAGTFESILIRQDNGTLRTTGQPTQLRIGFADIPVGSRVRVECTGEDTTNQKPGQSPMKTFSVKHKKP